MVNGFIASVEPMEISILMVFITKWVCRYGRLFSAEGDSDGAATNDYQTLGVSAQMNLSKNSDLTIGYIKQDFDSRWSDFSTSRDRSNT